MDIEGLMSPQAAHMLSPIILSYIGDAVYELVVRSAGIQSGLPADKLHQVVVSWVSAEGQSVHLELIESTLTKTEADIARRGRNAKGGVPQRSDPATYRRSSALEAVIGYVYLTGDFARVTELMAPVTQAVGQGRGQHRARRPYEERGQT